MEQFLKHSHHCGATLLMSLYLDSDVLSSDQFRCIFLGLISTRLPLEFCHDCYHDGSLKDETVAAGSTLPLSRPAEG